MTVYDEPVPVQLGDVDRARRAAADNIGRWESRVRDSAARFSAADLRQVEDLALEIATLRELDASGARTTFTDRLLQLYEGPLPGNGTATLDDLVARARAVESAVRARVRPTASWPSPVTGTHSALSPHPSPITGIPVLVEPSDVLERTAGPPALPGVVRKPPRDGWSIASEALTALGALIVVFVLYAVFGTGLSEARSQRQLEREFDRSLQFAVAAAASGNDGASGVLGGSQPEEGDTEEEEIPTLPPIPARGDAAAIISLPTIGVNKVVVEGTRASDLMRGPGHLRSSPMPGRAGNSVLFGRRTTFGGPFGDIDELAAGDPIDVTTTDGVFRYIVQSVERVGSGDPNPIGATSTDRLTLVTSDERYAAGGRLVVISRLDGLPVAGPTTPDGRPIPLPDASSDDLGTKRTGTDWAWILVWTQLLVVVYLGTRWLYRHWLPRSTWLVSAPVILVVAFAWLDSLARIFPSTL